MEKHQYPVENYCRVLSSPLRENFMLADQLPLTNAFNGAIRGGSSAISTAISGVMGSSPNTPKNATPVANSQAPSGALSASAGGSLNSNNTNMSLLETTEVAATTLFVNDSAEKVQLIRPTTLDESLAVAKTDDNSIALFMSKPVQIDTLAWSSSSGANTVLSSYQVSDYIDGGSVPTIWANKISGYNLMRGTCVLKIILNSQPFQAGRLLIHFLPNNREFNTYSDVFTKVHNFTLCQKTQQPNVELDISDGTATIEIPYVSPALWYSRSRSFDWGTVYVTVLSPLASAASTTVNASVYMYWKDFELAAPIYGPEGFLDGVGDFISNAWNSTKNERSKTKESGVVTTFFDFVKKPLDMLTSVPVIGAGAQLASNAAKSLGDVFSYFGWSRPYDIKGTQIVKQHNMYRGFNFNGTTTSDVLAMDSMNQIVPMTNYAGSAVDEMSFNYLKTIPAFIGDISWSTSSATNVNLLSQELSPSTLFQPSTISLHGNTVTANSYPPFGFISRFFRYYRGGISITIKIVKTQFHSGRLAVTYTPSNSNYPTTAEGRAYVYREIIDIRESDTFNFVLPYMHPAPYLNTGFNNPENVDDYAFGIFRIDILNPLVAATTVSSAVDILIYANAAEDFQLVALQDPQSFSFAPEMNTDVPRISGPIGDAPVGKNSIEPSALCAGEFFTSLKQLLISLRPIGLYSTAYSTSNLPTGFLGASFFPSMLALPRQQASPAGDAALDSGDFCCDYLSEIAPGFVYSRGGIRMSHPEASATSASGATWLSIAAPGGTAPIRDICGVVPNISNPIVAATNHLVPMSTRNSSSTLYDVIVPHYGQTPFRLNYVASPFSNGYVPTTYDSPDYILNVAFPATTTIFSGPSRSGADDYALGYFIGFPPVVTSSSLFV